MNRVGPMGLLRSIRRRGPWLGLLLAACQPAGLADGLGPASTGSLAVTIAGLPSGATPVVTVTGPAGFVATLAADKNLPSLAPGTYTVVAADVTFQGNHWVAASGTQFISITSGQGATSTVAYAATTGSLQLTRSGLPSGLPAPVLVSGPNGFNALLLDATTLTGLNPGSYELEASVVGINGDLFQPAPAVQQVAVVAGTEVATVAVAYAVATGRLTIAFNGVPVGGAPAIMVHGPAGYAISLNSGTTLVGLEPGSYTLQASAFTMGTDGWGPAPASQVVTVSASLVPAVATVAWSQTSASLAIMTAGLPQGVSAAILVSGPNGYSRAVLASETLVGLDPGSYTINATPVASGSLAWDPVPASQVVAVVAGSAASAGVAWTLRPGALQVTIVGLPSGAPAAVTVSGPQGFSQQVSASQLLGALPPGLYTIVAQTVQSGGYAWDPSPASQSVTLGSGTAAAGVSYAAVTGGLALTISGLPTPSAQVTITGPGGFLAAATADQTFAGLLPGAYQVAASAVTIAGTPYQPAPASQSVAVMAGGTAAVSVGYAAAPAATLNLQIAGAYLTQAVQRLDHSVELVAGRDAYLQVFVVANEANAATPQVRVRLYHGGSEVQAWLLNAATASVTQAVDEGTVSSSWNVLVPGALVVPGMQILAEVDPSGQVMEQDEGDNLFPANGLPMPIAVRDLLPFQIRLVPVLQSVNGQQGSVTTGNMEGYLATLKQILPVGAYDLDVRAGYTTNAPVLQSGNGNGAWGTILSEILALRNATDASSRYYYGVVHTTYSSGIAGLGYVPSAPTSTAKAAIGWDASSSRARILAHEVGHNLGRSHAPCGGVSNPDPNYPYLGGGIGAWGLDPTTLAVKPPGTFFDLMGYCPPNEWVSDYNWNAMLNFRSGSPTGAPQAAPFAGGADDGVLVWGRITPTGVILEPAFRVAPTGQALPRAGAWRVEARDAAGALLFSQPFEPEFVPDLPGGPEQHFAMVLPVGAATASRIAALRVSGPGGFARQTVGSGAAGPDPVARIMAPGRRRVSWDAAQHPMALVRDAITGEILSFARGGAIDLWSNAGQLDIQLSDGVAVVTKRVVVR